MTSPSNSNEIPKINLSGFFQALFPEGVPTSESCCGNEECVDTEQVVPYNETIRVLRLAEQCALDGDSEGASTLINIADRYAQL